MRDALRAHEGESSILYSLCNWGHAHVERWGNETGQSWRMWGDIVPQWDQQLDWSWGFSERFLPSFLPSFRAVKLMRIV